MFWSFYLLFLEKNTRFFFKDGQTFSSQKKKNEIKNKHKKQY